MEKILQQIVESITRLEVGQAQILKEIDIVNQRLDNMPTKDDLKNAIEEGQRDILSAIDITATKSDVSKIISRIEVLSIHSVNQEAELRALKLAK